MKAVLSSTKNQQAIHFVVVLIGMQRGDFELKRYGSPIIVGLLFASSYHGATIVERKNRQRQNNEKTVWSMSSPGHRTACWL
jgi:hypothetical protein